MKKLTDNELLALERLAETTLRQGNEIMASMERAGESCWRDETAHKIFSAIPLLVADLRAMRADDEPPVRALRRAYRATEARLRIAEAAIALWRRDRDERDELLRDAMAIASCCDDLSANTCRHGNDLSAWRAFRARARKTLAKETV